MQKAANEEKAACRSEMASMMRACSGIVVPKSEHVDFSLVLQWFLKGQRSEKESKTANKHPSRSVFWWKKFCKNWQKEEKAACKSEMASMMRACAGLVGPKSENVDFSLVLQWFLKGQRSDKESRNAKSPPDGAFFGGKSVQKAAKRRKGCL